ncbi:N-acetyl-gamma-glutamyl-phosphate reductase [Elongatibacter sediminis]|uniref:N-acetyl-gamma-glutamyl-phosphate reductase n=1 Tax=Elongatibacter sediminis TaxID=3119006 RepID=A0AAW9RG86_9GAMM
MTIETVVIGGRGHTGSALLPLLDGHPEITIRAVASGTAAGEPVAGHVEAMRGSDLVFSDLRPDAVRDLDARLYILALPNGKAGAWVEAIDTHCPDAVIVDLSADYRFDDQWSYGLPEHFAPGLRGATRIANPGCYATGAQLALTPVRERLAATPVVFGVSGYSGAGKTPSRKNDPLVLADNLLPYALADHIHERELSHHLGRDARFMPHVASFFRGISLTVAVEFAEPCRAEVLHEQFRDFYGQASLVQVTASAPEVAQVRDSAAALVGGFTVSQSHPTRAAIVCVLDNLLKGAASQAVQNINLAFGLDELSGLEHCMTVAGRVNDE